MMLEKEFTPLATSSIEKRESDIVRVAQDVALYLHELFGRDVHLAPAKNTEAMPRFLTTLYRFFASDLFDHPCIFMVPVESHNSAADIAKHLDLAESHFRRTLIYAAKGLTQHVRDRFLQRGVQFVVPHNQFFVPELGISIREQLRKPQQAQGNKLTPTGQMLLFQHILESVEGFTPTSLAKRLGVAIMSMSRAFNDLEEHGLAESAGKGRERAIHFVGSRRELFEKATPLLVDPVRKSRALSGAMDRLAPLTGECALSEMTALANPPFFMIAISDRTWKRYEAEWEFRVTDLFGADYILETWSYDPNPLAAGYTDPRHGRHVVDPLSLYARFKDHKDERVVMAAEQYLERVFP